MKTAELQIKYITAKDLFLLEGNPRKRVDEDAVEKLKVLIEGHGFQNPLQVYEEKRGRFSILCGNHRFLAARDLGMESFPCIVYEGSREMAMARAISDNRSSEWTDWDYTALKDMVCDLDTGDFNVELTGFTDEELTDLFDIDGPGELEGEDEAPKAPQTPETKVGDMYQLGDHHLLCGDCGDMSAVKRIFGDLKADCMVTDPPYGVDYSGKNEFLNKFDKGNRNQKPIENDAIEDYRRFFAEFLQNIQFADYNTFYIFMSGKELHNLRMGIEDAGYKCADYLVWAKNNHVLGRKDYNSKHEFIVYGWKDKHKFYGPHRTTVLEYDKPLKSDLHPTMKPVQLLEQLIADGSPKEGRIYDPFGGSGSTMIACEKLKRKCYMMEIDPAYCDVIVERYKTLFPEKEVCLLSGENQDVTGDGCTTGQTG